MTTLTKTSLAVSATGFIVGSIVDFGNFVVNPAWTVAMPLGAIFFGVFLISLMMEKEMAKFDEEEAKKRPLIQRSEPKPKPATQPTFIQLKEKTL